MRRAFTLIEVMMASAISIIVFTAIFVSLYGIWNLAGEAMSEMQVVLHARNVKERMCFNIGQATDGTEYFGLYNAKNIRVSKNKISATFLNVPPGGVDVSTWMRNPNSWATKWLPDDFDFLKNSDGAISFKAVKNSGKLFVYMTVKNGNASEYYERFVVSDSELLGKFPSSGNTYGFFDKSTTYYERK